MSNTKFNIGDLVEGTKGVCVVRGVVEFSAIRNRYINFDGFHLSLAWLRTNEWDLDLIKAAPVPLPTTPGIYRDRNGSTWRVGSDGVLSYLSAITLTHESFQDMEDNAARYAPFTLLAPVTA